MEENKDGIGIIEKLAILADAAEQIFPEGNPLIAFQLNSQDFKLVQDHFRTIDHHHTQFKIDMSGVEMFFILDESLINETDNL
jgi:hypothetical protein